MKRALFSALAVSLIAAACAGTSGTTVSPRDTSTGTGPTGDSSTIAPATTIEIPDGETATLVRLFDGDSFEAEVDGQVVEVRMLGINAPEGFECHGDAARDRLRELIGDGEITLVAEGEDTEDRFGRLLRSVYNETEFVNAVMVREGHALALQGGDPQERVLTTLLDEAARGERGLWGPQACGEDGAAGVQIAEIEYDPSGRDWENKSEEWIIVFNDSPDAVDVSGWILRDESSTHRYEFADGEVLASADALRVRTGCGDDRGEDRYWCADDAVWSNGGDTVILQTAEGTVVDWVRYDGDY